MPRKRYDDEMLRERALELRGRGLTYREIAKELGCSVYKIHELLSPIESPKSRIKQVVELSKRVEELRKEVEELGMKIEGLRKLINDVKPLQELSEEVRRLGLEVGMICVGAGRRAVGWCACRWITDDGYCGRWAYPDVVEGYDMIEFGITESGQKFYLLNVRKHPQICTGCPNYEPKDITKCLAWELDEEVEE